MDQAMNKSYAGQGAALGLQQASAANYAGAMQGTTAAIQTESEGILSRLNMIRANFSEARGSLNAAADKIVGYAPTPISSNGQIKGDRPPASCFLDALSQVIGEIETIGSEIQEHLNRLHRPF